MDLALKRIRWTFSVSEWGDSHRCYPADMCYEHGMVQQTKIAGQRNPAAFSNLESRVQLHSYMRMREIESRSRISADTTNLATIHPSRASKAEEQCRVSRSMVIVWLSLLGQITPHEDDATPADMDAIQGFGSEESQLLFTDRSRQYYRSIDACDHILVTWSAFKKGFYN